MTPLLCCCGGVAVVVVVVFVFVLSSLWSSRAMTLGGDVFSFWSWNSYKIGGNCICLSSCLKVFEYGHIGAWIRAQVKIWCNWWVRVSRR
jgi:hypothetical protein